MALRVGVIVVSVGERPWWPVARVWLERYCREHDYELVVVDKPLIAGLGMFEFDRFQNFGRVQKLGIGPFFDRFDRIIQMDDTCMVSPLTPALTEIVPEEVIGCWIAGPSVRNFKAYAADHQKVYNRPAPLAPTSFYNSGVAVYSRKHRILFDQKTIPWRKIKADFCFPTQGYLSDRCEWQGFALHDLGEGFNTIGSKIPAIPSPQAQSVFIFHLTSTIKDRLALALQIDQMFRAMVPEALAMR